MSRSKLLLLVSSSFFGIGLSPFAAMAQEIPEDQIVVVGKTYGEEVGAKALASLKEVSNSVTVVDQQRIQDQNLFTLFDVVQRTTGVTVASGNSDYASFRSRGFEIDSFLIDGVPNAGFTAEIPDLFIYDRVEILRGPAGLFSGSGSPAGSINLVRKRPLVEPRMRALIAGGSWNNYRGELDISTPLSETLSARAGLAVQDRDEFVDVSHKKRFTAFANLQFKPSDATTFILGGHIDRYEARPYEGVPASTSGGLPDFPRSRYGGLAYNESSLPLNSAFAEVRHDLGRDWVIRLSGQYGAGFVEYDSSYTSASVTPPGISPAKPEARLVATRSSRDQDFVTADLNLVGFLNLFSREHQFVAGADFQRRWRLESFGPRLILGQFNFANPDYEAFPRPTLAITSQSETRINQYGAYGQLRLNVADPLTIVLGGRIGWFEQNTNAIFPTPSTRTYRKNGRFVPYAGLVFDITPDLTAYANYADTFTPQTSGLKSDGTAPDPATGKQYEVGLKQELFDDRLLLTVAAFQIDQTGLAQRDPADARFVTSSGKVRSRGFEVEANGTLAPGWTVNGGYAYTKLRYLTDQVILDPANEGQQPRHSVKLWTSYKPQSGALAGWSVSAGLTYQSSIWAALTQQGFVGISTVRQKGYAVADARLGYQITPNVEIAGTVNNLFDEKYFERVNGVQLGNLYGAPRNFLVTARVQY